MPVPVPGVGPVGEGKAYHEFPGYGPVQGKKKKKKTNKVEKKKRKAKKKEKQKWKEEKETKKKREKFKKKVIRKPHIFFFCSFNS